ncbi:hypothetical protein VTJ04DRAFT_2227 [Mycothermus thermophilus]|uniref:uncharacterized protein n=1 Tax=Humicola insolens TaxID=85995 RepID=UPI003742D356
MDMRDDPNTTTTTDYDSGDSVGADYVYPSQRIVEKKHVKEHTKARSPARRRSPKAKARSSPRCTCGLDRSDDDDDHGNSTTVFEDESETEEDRCEKHKRPTKPRPSVHRGSACHHDVKEKLKADHKRRASETKSRRAQTPYVEEYPDEIPRPTVLLKEHRILRRASMTDAKRLRDLEGRSQSTGSRGRSPTGKRLPTRPRRRSPKESPKRHHKRRLESHTQHESDKSSESDSQESKTDSNTDSGSPHRAPPEPEPRPTRLNRSKTWSGNTHSAYSSSWPLHAASRATHERSRRKDYDDDNESESDESDSSKYEQSRIVNIGKRREERHHSKQHVRRASRDYDEEDQSESRSSNYEQPRPSAGKHREERHHSKQHTRRTSRDYDDDDKIQSNSSDYDQPRGKHREERHHTKQHVRRTSRDYDDGDDKSEDASSDYEKPRANTGKHREERHHAKQHVRRMSKEYTPRECVPDQEHRRERQHTREEGRRYTREERQQQNIREKERDRSPSRSPSPPRPSRLRTVASRSSMTTIDQGYSRSVATSLCEVWRGHAADWESPYVSPGTDSDLDDSDLDDDGQPARLLGMDDVSSRSESPRLLPARGDRSEVSVRARDHYHLPPTTCTDNLPLPPTSVQRSQTWPAPPHHHHHYPYVLDNGLAQPLTAEPDAMTDDGPAAGALIPRRPSSRASSLWPSGPGQSGQDPSPSRFRRSVTHPLSTHGSRAAAVTSSAPVFAARRTREFLSPRPTRAAEARFDFRAWECFSWG